MNLENKKLVSVIIPVYNVSKGFFIEALDSIANQTLGKSLFEIVIVDDCSTDKETLDFLSELAKEKFIKGIDYKIIRHEKNMWLAKTRITGAKNANGKYLVFMDPDDKIKEDYLQKAVFLLEASPTAGWAYPNVRYFGHFDKISSAPEFSAKEIFFNNCCATASMYRKKAWLEVLQREIIVTDNIRFFEDWDTIVRLMAKGWFGIPLNDSEFLYRQNTNSLISRSDKLLSCTRYINWRENSFSFLKIFKAESNFKKYKKEGYGRKRNLFNINTYLDRFSAILIKNLIFNNFDRNNGFTTKYFPFKLLFYSIFSPKSFIKYYLNADLVKTKAEDLCGFVDKPVLNFKKEIISGIKICKKIMFAHNWWRFGGAENILFNWIVASKKIDNLKIIEVGSYSEGIDSTLMGSFAEISNNQYVLDRISPLPLIKLKFCWNLIANEKPDVIFINANSFIYALLPLIKKEFPEIKIIDILHNEELFNSSWYGVSDEYKQFIDYRVVTSSTWQKVMVEKYKENPKKVYNITNLVDLEKFDPKKYDSEEIKNNLGLLPGKTTIGFVGRLDEQKNPMIFLELAELMKEEKDFQFIMVGDGTHFEEIKKRSLNLKNFVIAGYSTNIPYYLRVCDVLVCPSKYEGFPMVGLEAAAMQVPIIATDTIGFREQINEGKFGWLYSQTDNSYDAKKIRDIILANKHVFSETGKAGRAFIEKNHNFTRDNNEYTDFIKRALGLSN